MAQEQAEEQGQDQSSELATKKAMGRKESAAVNRQRQNLSSFTHD